MLEANGIKPEIVLYLETPPDTRALTKLLAQLGITPRALLRTGEPEYKGMKLADVSLPDDKLIAAMVSTPKLIQRPIVVKGNKAVLGRPPENVLALIAGQ